MKKIMLSLTVIIMASILALSIPVMGMGQRGMDDDGPPGPGSGMAEDHQKGPLQKGFNYRYGMGKPEASVENENGEGSIGLSLGSVEFEKDGKKNSMIIDEEDWEVTEEDSGSGKKITYSLENEWKGEGDAQGTTSRLNMLFNYRWLGDDRGLDIEIEMTDPPSDGQLTVGLAIETEGFEQGCSWNRGSQSGNGHSFEVADGENNDLGEIIIDEMASIDSGTIQDTVTTDVDMEIIETTQTLSISSAISSDADSYKVGGSLNIFDELLDAIGDAAEDTASFIMDHIISFMIGTGALIIILVGTTIFLSRKGSPTSGEDLVLENNRFYRKD